MKLIFSRKGFDSTYGGCASPIFEDGELCSIPIPDRFSPTLYRDVRFNGASIAPMVKALTRGKIAEADGAHLDPDLRRESIARDAGWRPIFGQADAAASHLEKCRVGVGDLFIFFGSFRQTIGSGRDISFVPRTPVLHVIFGWLQVGAIHPMSPHLIGTMPWARTHPHFVERERYRKNTIYVASDTLDSIGLATPGAGVFDSIRPQRILTQQEPYIGKSIWRLPMCFEPRDRAPLTYHAKASRWTLNGASVQLQTVGRGQEFVLDLGFYPAVKDWARGLFRD